MKPSNTAIICYRMSGSIGRFTLNITLLQVRYHPEMQFHLEDRATKDKNGRRAVVWNNHNYIRHKKHDYLQEIGNKYTSFYLFKNQVKRNNWFMAHSDDSKHYRYVFYCTETGIPYDIKGKLLKQKQRWDELKNDRDQALRKVELSDIKKYKVAIDTLQIPPIYIPSKRMPSFKWFLDHTISPLSEARVEELRNMKRFGSTEEADSDIIIPRKPTRANRDIAGSVEGIVERGRAPRLKTHL